MNVETLVYLPNRKLYSPVKGCDPVRDIEARALELFGGYTWRPGITYGGWVDDSGAVHTDECQRLAIAVSSFSDLALLVAFAREIGSELGEQSIYVRALGVSECVDCGGGQ